MSTIKPKAAELAPIAVLQHPLGEKTVEVAVQPTQVRRPWRSTARTVFQAGVALAALWPIIVSALGLPDWAWIGVSLAVAAGITRVMALPGVEVWLRKYVAFLAAAPQNRPGD